MSDVEVLAPDIGEPDMSLVATYPDVGAFSQDHPDDPYRVEIVEPIANPGAKLLYRSATGFEKALADVDNERIIRIAAEIIKVQWNPWQIPERNLPFLAWAMGVNLWENWWQPEFKRWWVANQWYLKSIRGTRLGLDEYIKAVGGSTKRVITPPATAFGLSAVGDIVQSINYLVPGADWEAIGPLPSTRAQYDGDDWIIWRDERPKPTWDELVLASRAQYIARFPQLRIYPFEPRIQLQWLCFLGSKKLLTIPNKTPSRHNFVSNPTFAGGSASPDLMPNSWELDSSAAGMTHNIIGFGTEDNIPYVDVQISGTYTGTGTGHFDWRTFTEADTGQDWQTSAYIRRMGGTLADASVSLALEEWKEVSNPVLFSPLDLGGNLIAWFDGMDTSSFTQVSGKVTKWANKQGNTALDAVQNNATNRPTLNGAAHGIENGNLDIDGPTGYAAVFVATSNTNASNWRTALSGGGNANHFILSNGGPQVGSYASAFFQADSLVWNAGNTKIGFIEVPASGNVKISVDGGTVYTTGATPATSRKLSYINDYVDGGGQQFGIMKEIVLIPMGGDTTRQRVEGYLAHRWGLAANLPADHPYKLPTSINPPAEISNVPLTTIATATATPTTDPLVDQLVQVHGVANTIGTTKVAQKFGVSFTNTSLPINMTLRIGGPALRATIKAPTHVQPYNKNGSFLGPLRPLFPTNYNAGGKYTRQARLYEPLTGEETDLTFRTITSVDVGPYGVRKWDQVTLPGHKSSIYHEAEPGKYLRPYPNWKRGVFLGRLHSTSSRMVIIPRDTTLGLHQPKAQYQTIFPDNKLMQLRPEYVAIKHPRRGTAIPLNQPECYSGGGELLYRKFLPKSLAYKYLYERWYLFDADRVPDVRRANVFMGNARFGIHKYTAEAHVKIRGKLPRFIMRTNNFLWGFTRPKNLEPVERLRRGVRASMALRDKVLLNTKTNRVVQVRDLLDATGRYKVGQVIPN